MVGGSQRDAQRLPLTVGAEVEREGTRAVVGSGHGEGGESRVPADQDPLHLRAAARASAQHRGARRDEGGGEGYRQRLADHGGAVEDKIGDAALAAELGKDCSFGLHWRPSLLWHHLDSDARAVLSFSEQHLAKLSLAQRNRRVC